MTCNPQIWKPQIRRIALHQNVLIVAETRIEGAWSAFCGPVPGINHNEEWQEVARVGDTLPEEVARVLFPEHDNLPYTH